jgi:hypothetical protein
VLDPATTQLHAMSASCPHHVRPPQTRSSLVAPRKKMGASSISSKPESKRNSTDSQSNQQGSLILFVITITTSLRPCWTLGLSIGEPKRPLIPFFPSQTLVPPLIIAMTSRYFRCPIDRSRSIVGGCRNYFTLHHQPPMNREAAHCCKPYSSPPHFVHVRW